MANELEYSRPQLRHKGCVALAVRKKAHDVWHQ
jgi:hypothetical protein